MAACTHLGWPARQCADTTPRAPSLIQFTRANAGFAFWFFGMCLILTTSLSALSVAALMPDMGQRCVGS